MRMDAMQQKRIAGEAQPAERGETRSKSARDRKRITDADRPAPVDGVPEHRRQRRFKRPRTVKVERHVSNAEILRQLQLTPLRRKSVVRAIELEPTGAAEISLRFGLPAQGFVRATEPPKSVCQTLP